MKKLFILILFACQVFTISAQKKNPKWVEKAVKAIFTVEVTNKDGSTKIGCGFFIHENGEAVSSYDLFQKANKAVITTSDGEKFQVIQILGADDMYGVIRYKVAVPKKSTYLQVASIPPATNMTAYLPPSKEEANLAQGIISEISKVNGTHNYYTVDMPLPSSQVGYPLLTETGEVFAMTQIDASGKGKTYGLSISYIQSLEVSAMDMLKRTYSDIGIRTVWPSNVDDASVSLMLYSSKQDARTYLETLNDFIKAFPNNFEGYNSRASHYAYNRKELASTENEQLQMLDFAWKDLESSAKYATDKGVVYFNKARLIFSIISSDSTIQYTNWNAKSMEENLQKAIATEDLPTYRHLEADIAFNKGDFQKAYDTYSIVNASPAASGASYYLAAKSLQQVTGHNYLIVIALIDSAIAKSPVDEGVTYLLENIELKMSAGLYEQVVKDYDLYYLIRRGDVSDEFYYYREQAKYRSNDFEGALKDIERAILMNGDEAIYHAEMASVYLRLTDLPNASKCAEKAIEKDPDFASAYRILGVSLVRQEKKAEACINFNKAKELGDPVAEKLIKDNCN
jgi:hypothetical protein